jgi:hypothetical protein
MLFSSAETFSRSGLLIGKKCWKRKSQNLESLKHSILIETLQRITGEFDHNERQPQELRELILQLSTFSVKKKNQKEEITLSFSFWIY